jgi:nucleotide-binding universal stress UspA family protein
MTTTTAPLRTILLGLDGSPGAERALTWATARASESGASIRAVHVLTSSTELRREAFLDTITTWRRHLAEPLREEWAAPDRAGGVTIHTEVVEDDRAASGLVKAAEDPEVDLVVLGA